MRCLLGRGGGAGGSGALRLRDEALGCLGSVGLLILVGWYVLGMAVDGQAMFEDTRLADVVL